MKTLGLILVILLALSGCATFNHSESIDTDQSGGFASGKYQYSGTGPNGSVLIGGGGAGWGGAGGGVGAGVISVTTGPSNVSGLNFARSIAMINYSKRLKSITYDEAGGLINYEFEPRPFTRSSEVAPGPGKSSMPSSFGYKPVE
jgi:hypothetical protein